MQQSGDNTEDTDTDGKQTQTTSLYRRTTLQSAAAVVAMGAVDSVRGETPAEFLTKEPDQRDPQTTGESTTNLDAAPTALVIRDCLSWDTTANEDALQELGFEYDVISSQTALDQLPDYDQLDAIDVIIIPSTQSTEYYTNLNSIWDTLIEFVDQGGVLSIHAGEAGWPCRNPVREVGSKLSLPRGVNNEYTFLPADPGTGVETLQELTVTTDDHPIAEGMDNATLSYWASDISSFGYYSGVPEDATAIFGLQTDPNAYPSYIEYPFGQGVILTTMQPPEWPFVDGRGGTRQLLLNELEYAVNTAQEIADPPTEGRIQGSITVSHDEELPADTTAYLIDPTHEPAVQDYIDGTDPLPDTEAVASVTDTRFIFDEIPAGRRLVLIDPAETFDPEYKLVAVPTEETTSISFELDVARPLSGLDPAIDEIERNTRQIIANSTADISNVHFTGATVFDSELDKGDYLNMALQTAQLAMGLSPDISNVAAAAEIGDFLINTQGVVVEEHGYNQYLAGRVTDTESKIQADLADYTDQILDIDWLVNLDPNRYQTGPETLQVFLTETEVHSTATTAVDDTRDRYETDIVRQDPHEEFSLRQAKQVLQVQARWLADNGLAPGVVVTPEGSGYVTRKTKYHRNHFDAVHDELETTDRLETASTAVSVAGAGVTKAGVGTATVGGVGIPVAAIGSVAAIGGQIGSYAFRAHSMNLQNQLVDAYADALIYWVDDIKNASTVVTDILDWLEAEAVNPTLQDISGTIRSTTLGGTSPPFSDTTFAPANRPDYPAWIVQSPIPTPQHRRVATNTVAIENTGDSSSEFTLTTIDTYGSGNENGVSDAVSVRPDRTNPNDTLDAVLQPGESTEVDVEYISDFHWDSPFNWHTMTTVLWMNGKSVDSVEDPYYVIPSMDVVPFSAQTGDSLSVEAALSAADTDVAIETQSYRLTDASKGPYEALTVDDWTEQVGDIIQIIDASLSTEQSTSGAQFDVGSELQGVAFVLAAPPDATLNLHIYDERGRHVGYEPADDADVVEIPSADYTGSDSTQEVVTIDDAAGAYGIEAEATRFVTTDAVPVSVYAVEIPQREAILGVSPTTAGTVLEPGSSETVTVTLSETGGQSSIEVTDVSLDAFETDDGTQLEDVTVSLSEEPTTIAANGADRIQLTFDAATSLSIPDGASRRYWAELTVETATAGTTIVDTTVLVFSSDVDAQLGEAGIDVESVSVAALPKEELPGLPKDGLTVSDSYEINVRGDGIAVVNFPSEFIENKLTTAYLGEGGEWTALDVSRSERVSVEIEAPSDATLLIAQEDADEVTSGASNIEGVTQEQYEAVLPNGTDTTLGELRTSVDHWTMNRRVDGVELTLGELRRIVNYWATNR